MTFLYFVCESCGHTETRPRDVEPQTRCENCGAGATYLRAFDDLGDAEDWSQLVLDGDLAAESDRPADDDRAGGRNTLTRRASGDRST